MLYLASADMVRIKEKIAVKESRMLSLGHDLGDAMSRSGSFPASSPEYAAVHLEMKNLQNSLDYLKEVLNKYSVIEPEKADTETIDNYSMVIMREKVTGEQICYYVSLTDLDKKPDVWCMVATPESPVGKALLGHKLGDEIKIALPSGTKSYTITGHGKQY
jgi:transcription elongation factor GreA